MKKSRLLGAVCAGLSVISFYASADIVRQGYLTSDDTTNIIVNTAHNVEYLRFDVLADMNYAQTVAVLDTKEGGGWSIATHIDAMNFIDAAFVGGHTCFFTGGVVNAYSDCGDLDRWFDGKLGANFTIYGDAAWFLDDAGQAYNIFIDRSGMTFIDGTLSIEYTDEFVVGGTREPITWLLVRPTKVPIPPSVSIVIPDGTFQECAGNDGSNISMYAEITLEEGDEISVISWALDGDDVAWNESVDIFVPLGRHYIEATVFTVLGKSATDSKTITVEDTTAPVISAAFIDAKTGAVITTIDDKDKAVPSYSISDACDPAPIVVSATAGVPADNVDVLKANYTRKISGTTVTTQGSGSTAELTVTAQDTSGNVSSKKAVLTIIP